MKKRHLLTKTTRLNELKFEDMMDEISGDLDERIARFQQRRWREIKRQTA